jgi:hypothetical protein
MTVNHELFDGVLDLQRALETLMLPITSGHTLRQYGIDSWTTLMIVLLVPVLFYLWLNHTDARRIKTRRGSK